MIAFKFTFVSGSRRDPEVGEINMADVGHYRETASHNVCLGAFSTGIKCPMLHFMS